MTYLIQLDARPLFANSKADWMRLNATTLRFDTWQEAEDFRREFCWEATAHVVPSPTNLDPRNVCSRCHTQLTGAYPGGFEPVVFYSCRMA